VTDRSTERDVGSCMAHHLLSKFWHRACTICTALHMDALLSNAARMQFAIASWLGKARCMHGNIYMVDSNKLGVLVPTYSSYNLFEEINY
jgi:hypothetical protein